MNGWLAIALVTASACAAASNDGKPISEAQIRAVQAAAPFFACDMVDAGSIEAMICGGPELSALDRKRPRVYAAASRKAVNEQRGRRHGYGAPAMRCKKVPW